MIARSCTITALRTALHLVIVGAFALLISSPAQAQERRIALVIGNGGYSDAPTLANPARDAMLIGERLRAAGFETTVELDLGLRHFQEALTRFETDLATAGPNAVGLFYYAGHGSEISGVNYLMPVDFSGESVNAASRLAVSIDDVLAAFRTAGTSKNFVVLDACRDNGFTQSAGFVQIDASNAAPPGTLIAFSTSPGQPALDGEGRNSPFASALALALDTPGLAAEAVFRLTRQNVVGQTIRAQVPWETSSLLSTIVFRPGGDGAANAEALERENERLLWRGIEDSTDPDVFRYYLDAYPDGAFRGLAGVRLEDIRAQDNLRRARERATPAGHGVSVRAQTVATPLGDRPALQVTSIDAGSMFFGQIIVGDYILSIDHAPVTDQTEPAGILEIALAGDQRVDLLVRRGVTSYSLALTTR